ncbi:hypothetical protein AS026_05555 [Rhizobium altiplani]|uniref:Uncharacterized protein n=1 Tax=Rhizobium altiplani TaxID=1864509 RepID=A0A109JN06_9HYPH|nr:hypothetical protein AS026_05555 [Rhizobium altiplani]
MLAALEKTANGPGVCFFTGSPDEGVATASNDRGFGLIRKNTARSHGIMPTMQAARLERAFGRQRLLLAAILHFDDRLDISPRRGFRDDAGDRRRGRI